MKTFKLYMKIIQKNKLPIIIYIIVFCVAAISMTLLSQDSGNNTFNQSKTRIAIFDNDNTSITQNLIKEIEKISDIKVISDNVNEIKNELFFRQIMGVVRIEKGFTEKIINNNKENSKIEINIVPNSYDSKYVELTINNYINMINKYSQNTEMSIEEIIEHTKSDLEKTTTVEVMNNSINPDMKSTQIYFNYLSYVLFATIIFGVSIALSTFRKLQIRRRIDCSPINSNKINFEITLGHIVFSIAIVTVLIGIWLIIKPQIINNMITWIYILNAFCIAFAALGISYFIGIIIKSKSAQTAASNVISLAMSFISGVFVPIEFLSNTVKQIASFTPTYWYVLNNQNIGELSNITFENMKPVIGNMAIQIAFGITFIIIAITISKKKRTSKN